MSYRNKTYVIFDGDSDMWAYAYMKGWKQNENVDFNFHDAHDLNVITDRASEDTVKRKLRERFSSAKQVIVLIGQSTKDLLLMITPMEPLRDQLMEPVKDQLNGAMA